MPHLFSSKLRQGTPGNQVLAELKRRATEDVAAFMEHDPGRLLLDALISNPAEGSAALLKNSKVVKPRPLAEWMRANDAHAVIWHPLQNKFFFASQLHLEAAKSLLPKDQ